MQSRFQSSLTRKSLIASLILLAALILLRIFLPAESRPDDQYKPTASQITEDRIKARVFVEKFDPYRNDVDQKTRTRIEKMLYNYAYILEGNDLYTATIRKDTYKMNSLPDKAFDLRMYVDIQPIHITYEVVVVKNKNTNHQQAFLVACAPKSVQQNQAAVCKDERGR